MTAGGTSRAGRAGGAGRTWRSWPIASIVFGTLLVVVVLAALAWRLSGGQIYVMTTPSMSPVTPVGSLILDRAPHDLAVGDTITFRPTAGGPTFTHRIVEILPGPRYKTEGWAEHTPDPWVLSPSELVGKTVDQVWGLGWFYRVLPFWAIGMLLYLLVVPHLGRRLRLAVGTVWWTALLVVPLVVWRPLVQGDVLATRGLSHRRIEASVVNTGLFPTADQVRGGRSAVLAPGHLGRVVGPAPHGRLLIGVTATLPWWGWALIGLLTFSPLVVYAGRVLLGWDSRMPEGAAAGADAGADATEHRRTPHRGGPVDTEPYGTPLVV